MGGSQIFGLPVARRRARDTSIRPTPRIANERGLRTEASDPPGRGPNNAHTLPIRKERGAEYHQMHNKPNGFKPRTPSASGMATDGRTLVAGGEKELGHLLHTIHPKASSQLLGNQDYELSQQSESKIDQNTRSLRFHDSSSTLRSFYDPQTIPLAVSQQTSNSSARDLALRKGCPPVVAMDKPGARPSRAPPNADMTMNSTKKTSSRRLDLSSLFPKPQAYRDDLLASRLAQGHADVPEDPIIPPAIPLGPSMRQNRRANTPNKAPGRLWQPEHLAPCFDNAHLVKGNIRKPRSGIKYWFDHFEDEDSSDCTQHEAIETRQVKPSKKSLPSMHMTPVEVEMHGDSSDSTSFCPRRSGPARRGNTSYLQSPPASEQRPAGPAREHLRLALPNWEFRNKHYRNLPPRNSTTQFGKSSSNPFDRVDLRKDSVLWLSSDDESDGDDNTRLDMGTTIPGIRDSLIVMPSDSSDVEIGTAHAVKTKRPKLDKEGVRGKAETRVPQILELPLHSLRVPERRSSKMFSFLSDQSKSLPSTREGSLAATPVTATSSAPVGNYLRGSATTLQTHDSFIKLMTVTPQEKSLLEAMRSRRASVRQDIRGGTVQRSPQGERGESTSPHMRPQTSGLEGGSASFLRLSQDSVSTLSAFPNRRRSISAGNILGFEEMEAQRSGSTEPTASQQGSMAHSSLPSTSSQESPLTPTLELEADNSARRNTSSTKRYSAIPANYQRHSRVRTSSSAVIVLDSFDDHDHDHDDSSSHIQMDDLPIWTFNGWPDTPGLAVVH